MRFLLGLNAAFVRVNMNAGCNLFTRLSVPVCTTEIALRRVDRKGVEAFLLASRRAATN